MNTERRRRIVTALVGGAAVLNFFLFAPLPWISAAILLVLAVGLWEIHRLLGLSRPWVWSCFGLLVLESYLLLCMRDPAFLPMDDFWLFVLAFFFALFIFQNQPHDFFWALAGRFWIGLLFIALPGGYLLKITASENAREWLVWWLCVTWAMDSGGYFFGTLFGRRLLAPKLSPSKTWEGFFGAALGAVAAALGLWGGFSSFRGMISLEESFSLALLFTLFGHGGDLAESLIKRSVKAKDSGSFFPGHGGWLDRMDSLLWNAPVLYFFLHLS